MVLCGLIGSLCACHDGSSASPQDVSNDPMIDIAHKHSGYLPSSGSWKAFLACWKDRVDVNDLPRSVMYQYDVTRDTDFGPIEIARAEDRLGLAFSKSYIDFMLEYRPVAAISPSSIGMLPPSEVSRLAEWSPELIRELERYPVESSDDVYFVYGTRQDDSSSRTSLMRDALVIGKYGDALFEVILLYPQVRTKDGEMQGALLLHSGEYRAPSFAELMRQLSFLETRRPEHVPPYSQASLQGSCADRLPLVEVWWDSP